ncbi:MAG: hypothetical protein CR997_06125 [Acidobacteria bacterium]|nr:MAG: hypothetical protein CR997_06125 [Acidobacteriota bacterium]
MIKRIKAKHLKPGMYIHKLECKWSHHPFFLNQFKVKTEKEVYKVKKAGIAYVQIDTEKGDDLVADITCFEEEIKTSMKIASEAKNCITGVMEDVKLGKHVQVDAVSQVVNKMTDSVFRNESALLCLGQIRSKDSYLFEHSVNIGVLLAVFGKHKGFSREVLDPLVLGAFMHDIGKIKIPDHILHKPGRLTKEEFEVMKMHVVYTEEVLEKTEGIPDTARQIASEHHEKINGQGYAKGLKKDEISLYGKMAGITDVYDALTASRCYHEGRPPTEALKMMMDWCGAHFETVLFQEFVKCMGVFPVGSFVELTNGQLALVLENSKNPLRPHVRIVMDHKKKRLLSPSDVSLTQSELRIVDVVDPKLYKINIGEFLG